MTLSIRGFWAMTAFLAATLDYGNGIGAKERRDSEDVQPREYREPVDARRVCQRRIADHGDVQQSGHVRPACGAEQPAIDRAGSGGELVMGRGGHRSDLPAAARCQMARRQAVHRPGRQMHLGPLSGNRPGEAAHQSAQIQLLQPRGGHHERRLRGHVSSEAAAAGLSDDARQRVLGDLSVPCLAARHAPASDRHRPVQIDRFQAEGIRQGRAQPRLLEAGPALSRRHRTYDHPRPGDGGLGLHCRKIRHDRAVPADGSADEGHRRPSAAGDLRVDARCGQPAPARQPRQAAFRQPRTAARHGAVDRPPGVHRHHRPRTRPDRRGAAAPARRLMGHAAGHAQRAAGLRPRRVRRTAPRRGRSWRGSATVPTTG